MVSKGYPDLTIEDWREYALLGCTETEFASYYMGPICRRRLAIVAKIVELVLNNGKCALCGEQIGPLTGDPTDF